MLGLWLALVITASPETAEIEIRAERTLHDDKKHLTTAEGQATLTTEGAAINADRIVYDRDRSVSTASGHVVARIAQGGKIAIVADLMTIRLDEAQQVREVFLYDGQAISKKDVSTEAFLAADTADKVERVGATQALLQGNHLVRDGTKWTVDELELVPCECDFKNPSWSITSSSATVDTEAERVSITNPVFRVAHVPVLWLPWLSLPLTERQSGLLFTRPNFGLLNGFSLEQPYFLTLGRSADLTLTPGFFTGSPGIGKPGTPGGPGPTGVAGPRLNTEFRYVPSSRAAGRVVLGLLYDFRTRRDVENATLREEGTQRGLRGELGWQHTQDFDKGFGTRVDLNVHSDGDYNRDLTVDVIASTATYLRSTASVFHRGDDHWVGLDVGLRQDIEWGYDLLGRGTMLARRPDPGTETGTTVRLPLEGYGPGTLQRLPALSFGWAPSKLLGPLRFDVEGDAVRLAPLFSVTGDEGTAAAEGAVLPESFARGVDRLFSPTAVSPFGVVRSGTGDRIWQPGEREARDRLMLLPRVSVSTQPLGALSISGFAAWRQLGWAGEASGRTWSRGYLLLGARLETEFSRSFGSLRHFVQPLAELRAIPFGLQGSSDPTSPAPVAYDAVDAAVPGITPRFQGVLEVRQRLMVNCAELFRLDVGQGVELSGADFTKLSGTLGETFGRAGVRIGWFSAQGLLRVDPRRATVVPLVRPELITRAAGSVRLDDGTGHAAWAAYEQLRMEGTAQSRQPIDLLFLIDRGFTSATQVRQLTFGASWKLGKFSLRYDALVAEKVLVPGTAPVLALAQQTAGVAFTPGCDCWTVEGYGTQAVLTDARGSPTFTVPNFGFSVTISKFGSIGR